MILSGFLFIQYCKIVIFRETLIFVGFVFELIHKFEWQQIIDSSHIL